MFTSHSTSRKGRELSATGWASGVLYWRETGQQLILSGPVAQMSDAESDALWFGRPIPLHAMSAASRQSELLEDAAALRAEAERLSADGYGAAPPGSVRRIPAVARQPSSSGARTRTGCTAGCATTVTATPGAQAGCSLRQFDDKARSADGPGVRQARRPRGGTPKPPLVARRRSEPPGPAYGAAPPTHSRRPAARSCQSTRHQPTALGTPPFPIQKE